MRIFVFGSNLEGRHGKGSALYAKKHHGAKQGVGVGRTGSAYAIPTKYSPYRTMSIHKIAVYVREFLQYALGHPELQFDVVAIGTGNAKYEHRQMAYLFHGAPSNVHLPKEWEGLS